MVYLYIAQCITDKLALRHHVYKVGCSKDPEQRVRTLSGSASTNVYSLIFKIKLPTSVKDTHVLSHTLLQHVVLYNNKPLQSKYIRIYGNNHNVGLLRRRELLMFGTAYSHAKIKTLFRRIIKSMTNQKTGHYMCMNTSCTTDHVCEVCVKYIRSIWNSIAYHKSKVHSVGDVVPYNILQSEKRFKLKEHTRYPSVGEFWLHTVNNTVRIAYIKTVHKRSHRACIQWWVPYKKYKSIRTLVSGFFSQQGTQYINLKTNINDWKCVIHMCKCTGIIRSIYKRDRNIVKKILHDYIVTVNKH